MNELRQAQEAGINFYDLPCELNEDQVDPLILPIVKRINESGWVWTAESCQGHPDAVDPVWCDNTDPMLRLVSDLKHEPFMLQQLVRSSRSMEGEITPTTPLRIYPQTPKPPWGEILVYVPAQTVFYRNRGLETFRRFAEWVNRPEMKKVIEFFSTK